MQIMNSLAAWGGLAQFQTAWLPNMWTGWGLQTCASEYSLEAGICGLRSTGLLFQAAVVCGMGLCTGCDCVRICPDVGVKHDENQLVGVGRKKSNYSL